MATGTTILLNNSLASNSSTLATATLFTSQANEISQISVRDFSLSLLVANHSSAAVHTIGLLVDTTPLWVTSFNDTQTAQSGIRVTNGSAGDVSSDRYNFVSRTYNADGTITFKPNVTTAYVSAMALTPIAYNNNSTFGGILGTRYGDGLITPFAIKNGEVLKIGIILDITPATAQATLYYAFAATVINDTYGT